MDPLRIVIRAAFAFVFLLALLRLSGKRTVAQGFALDFILALILGDMVDDLIWAEVSGGAFVAGVGTLFVLRMALGALECRGRPGGTAR